MPRRQTPFIPEHYYHLYNRGNNRQVIFFEPANYLYFLRGVKRYLCPVANIISYSLMPTHYHITARVKQQQTSEFLKNSEVLDAEGAADAENAESFWGAKISTAMMRLSVSYTKAINKRFSRVGSLFQGPFQAKPVDTYSYLLNLCLYIHANPVKDGLVAAPEDWPYSNYLEWMGERPGTLVDAEFVREHFGNPAEYRALLIEYLKTRNLPEDVRLYLQSLEK